MRTRLELISGKFSASFTKKDSEALWKLIGERLNNSTTRKYTNLTSTKHNIKKLLSIFFLNNFSVAWFILQHAASYVLQTITRAPKNW
jgi:hypothetical protein